MIDPGIEKTGENFRLVYDTKGRFTVHRITAEEAEYKLGKVKRVQLGKGGIPYLQVQASPCREIYSANVFAASPTTLERKCHTWIRMLSSYQPLV